jgi:AmmeMemoRadiSam system protein B
MRVRPAAVAGTFYPADAQELAQAVDGMLGKATRRPDAPCPKALIVPHAGLVYSGPIAATGFAQLAPHALGIRRVVLLGPTHKVAARGLVLPDADALETPLGTIPIDADGALALGITRSARVHAQEHSLEVLLPFLQRVLSDFRVVPLAVGHAEIDDVARALDALWGATETVIVVSSDLSHYLAYPVAKQRDAATAKAIVALSEGDVDDASACGAYPVRGLLAVARRRALRAEVLDLRSSGDTAGNPNDNVVGYGSFAFYASL